MHLSYAKINTISNTDRNELPLDAYHLGVLLGVHKTIFEPIACLVQTVQNDLLFDPHH
jgi:hypothetical protein